MNLNKVTLIGNLTADPKVTTLPSGQTVSTFGMATNYRWRDAASKSLKELAEFHSIVAWRRIGEVVAKYLKKGDRVFVEGRLQTRKWKTKNGGQARRTEIVANQLILLGGRSSKTPPEKPNQELAEEQVSVEPIPAK